MQRIPAEAAVTALADAGRLRPEPDPLRELAEWLANTSPNGLGTS